MIVCQDCPTNAPKAAAFASSCPEWFIGEEVFNGTVDQAPADLQPFFRKMEAFQNAVLDGRFRTYGELRRNGSECIVLVTEFKEFDSETEFWKQVEIVQQRTNAHLWIMQEDYEIEHSWQSNDANGNRIGEKFGPNHGRPFKQIELSWRIEAMTPALVVKLSELMAEATAPLWEAAGVGVC